MTTLDRPAVDALLARARIAGDDGQSNLRGMGRTVSPLAFEHRRTTAVASLAAVCAG